MSLYVLDAGIAIKWFVQEADTDLARKLLHQYEHGYDQLIAPDLLIAECGNVFWKRTVRGDLLPKEAQESMDDLLAMNIPLTPSSVLASKALSLAQSHNRTVYDCLYLSLAISHNCELLTADERFYNSMAAVFPQVQLLRNKTF